MFFCNAWWGQRTPDKRSETIPSSRITPDLQIHSFSSSVHLTHLLQGSGQRTPDTRSETIPSSRITPDLQIHSFSSSVHSLIFYRVQVREHLTRDQRPFLHPESLQIFRFTASSLQFTHSSSTGFRSDNTWHEIRDHSFIQNHSRSSDSQLLLFSSPHSSSTGFRSENTWQEIRDHSFIQNHSRSSDSQLLLFSSPHSSSTGFRSENTWHEIRDHSFIQNHSRSSDSQLLLFSSPHSSSTGFRSENTWHEIRDHSFIQNHSRSSDSQLLLFSSLTHLLQGSGQITPDTRSKTISSSRITPDLQIHSFFSSVHLTHLLQGSDQRTPDTRSEIIPSSRITPDLQIHSFFSSVHLTHLLQGSVQRTPDTRSETIPSSRITPDLQIHSFFSSVHSLIFYRVHVREHLTRDQRPFLHPESLQIFRFTASPLQFTHSSSTGFMSENTWPEIRDHSFIQNHSRSSDSQLLLFSSLIFYKVQVREHLTRDQRPFLHPESLQIFRYTASPLQFTSLIFYRVQIREHLTRDQRSFLHPESLQIFRFTASSLQFTHSSSTGFRSDNTWPEIRDHSFIQNHSRSSDSQLLLFSSLIFYKVQVREHLTRDQRSFLHPESLQIFRFTASPLQFTHSSSTAFRSENTWHEIRDHSFIQNHSRSSDSQLLLFSSLTHLLQGSCQRTPDTRSETIPSSRITPDLQIHSFSSSVHSLIFYRVHVREHLTRDQRPFLHPESLQIFRFTASPLQFTSLIFYRVQVREHLTRDQRPFLHPESLQIFRFTASPLQFTHSSSTGFMSENTWPETRDHSFIQNHSRSFRFTSSMTVLLLFGSLIFYRVQVRGLEWPAEAWFCAQWHIFVLFLRFVFGLLYGWKIQTWPIIRFLTESITYWFFYLLVFDIIHDATCLNKMSRTSSRNIGPQHPNYSSIFHCTHGVLFIPVFTKPILSVCW